MLVVLAVVSAACDDESRVTPAGPLQPGSTQLPANDEGGGEHGEVSSRTSIVAGDFDGYEWEFVVESYESLGPCLAVRGEPLPQEGEQLSSGSCTGPLEGLQWVSTTAALGTVVFGHAPAETASLEFLDGTGASTEVSTLHAHQRFPNVRFFIERFGEGAAPIEVAALDATGNVLATQPLLSAEALDDDQPLSGKSPG